MKSKAKTRTLDMFPDLPVPVAPSKAEKAEKKRRKSEEKERRRAEREKNRGGRKSFGREVSQPLRPDGSPIACPCGRVYLLPRLDAFSDWPNSTRVDIGYIFFDKEGPLGASSLGNGYVMRSYTKAVRLIDKHGCYLHERERERLNETSPSGQRPSALAAPQGLSRDATGCNLQVDLFKPGG